MPRVSNGPASRRRRKRVLKAAKGYYGVRHNLYRTAVEAVRKGMANAFHGRKRRKRDFRSLWITRIGITARNYGLSYSKFIKALSDSKITLNRKMLAEIAVTDPKGFEAIVEKVNA